MQPTQPNTYDQEQINSAASGRYNNPSVPTSPPAVLSSYSPPARISPQNYSVPVPTQVNSDLLTPTTRNINDVYNSKLQDMTSGKNPSLIPSDNLYSNIAGQVYNQSLYTPQEQTGLQNLSTINTNIAATQLAERRQIKQLQEDGQLTKDQAASFLSESQRRSDAQLADLAVAQSAQSNSLGVLGQIRGNNLTALQNFSSLIQPQQVAPGTSLFNPVTGVNYQGTGASPAQITSYAQTLKQNDQMTGNIHLTPQGTVDDNYYYQQAQQAYSTQGGTNAGGQGNVGGDANVSQGIPQQVQTYLGASGGQYINEDKVPANQQDIVKQLAAQNGVPYLSGDEVSKLRSIDVTNSNLDQLSVVATNVLGKGITGRTVGALWNNAKNILQLDPQISSYNSFRDTAINTIQALAGGTGSGLRLNAGEIETAVGNLPTINDNLETAQKKIALVQGFMNKWKSEILQGNPDSIQPASGNVIQTKVGAVDNSWFN